MLVEFLRLLFIAFLVSSHGCQLLFLAIVCLQGGKQHPLALLICCVLGNQNTNLTGIYINRESIDPEAGGRACRQVPEAAPRTHSKGMNTEMCVLMMLRLFVLTCCWV